VTHLRQARGQALYRPRRKRGQSSASWMYRFIRRTLRVEYNLYSPQNARLIYAYCAEVELPNLRQAFAANSPPFPASASSVSRSSSPSGTLRVSAAL